MELVIRGIAVYLFLLLIFRVSGKRSLRNATTFDFVLLLIVVLVGSDVLLSLVKRWSPRLDRTLEGQPLVILRDGVPLRSRMHIERVDEEDILRAAREAHGLQKLDQIERAVLERNGAISIVPREGAAP